MTEPYGNDDDPAYDDQDDAEDSGEKYARIPRSVERNLTKKARQADKLSAAMENLQRENVLLRNGLGDLTERQQKALFATIDGEFTAENARAAAEELGFVKPVEPVQPDPDQAALERMGNTSAGGTADSGTSEEARIARLHQAAAQGPEAFYAQYQADGGVVIPAG